mgnify:CR=1 FL=1
METFLTILGLLGLFTIEGILKMMGVHRRLHSRTIGGYWREHKGKRTYVDGYWRKNPRRKW